MMRSNEEGQRTPRNRTLDRNARTVPLPGAIQRTCAAARRWQKSIAAHRRMKCDTEV